VDNFARSCACLRQMFVCWRGTRQSSIISATSSLISSKFEWTLPKDLICLSANCTFFVFFSSRLVCYLFVGVSQSYLVNFSGRLGFISDPCDVFNETTREFESTCPGDVCSLDEAGQPRCCNTIACAEPGIVVCGSDGNTYESECALTRSAVLGVLALLS